jgi:hypothetical protein
LPNWAGGIALVLEACGDRHRFGLQSLTCRGNSDLGKASAIGALSGDERRAAGGTGLLTVGIGEHHAFLGDTVDIGRPVAHHAVRVATQVRLADIIAPNHEDIRLAGLGHLLTPFFQCWMSCRLLRLPPIQAAALFAAAFAAFFLLPTFVAAGLCVFFTGRFAIGPSQPNGPI